MTETERQKLLDMFAAHALAGLMSAPRPDLGAPESIHEAAIAAYDVAEFMLYERLRREKSK